MIECLERRAYDQHDLGFKPTCAILAVFLEKTLYFTFPAWWSWQEVLNCTHIFIKLQAEINNLASAETGSVIAYPTYWSLRHFPASQEDKYSE